MKINKKKIQDDIFIFLKKKNKKIKMNNKILEMDLFMNELIDSIDFLDLISFVEKKNQIKIDISNTNPMHFRKIFLLTNIIYKKYKK
jgi:acyl carrier protein